jgi:hypothetical protein
MAALENKSGNMCRMTGRSNGQQPRRNASANTVTRINLKCMFITRDNGNVNFDRSPDTEHGVVVRQLRRIGGEMDQYNQHDA